MSYQPSFTEQRPAYIPQPVQELYQAQNMVGERRAANEDKLTLLNEYIAKLDVDPMWQGEINAVGESLKGKVDSFLQDGDLGWGSSFARRMQKEIVTNPTLISGVKNTGLLRKSDDLIDTLSRNNKVKNLDKSYYDIKRDQLNSSLLDDDGNQRSIGDELRELTGKIQNQQDITGMIKEEMSLIRPDVDITKYINYLNLSEDQKKGLLLAGVGEEILPYLKGKKLSVSQMKTEFKNLDAELKKRLRNRPGVMEYLDYRAETLNTVSPSNILMTGEMILDNYTKGRGENLNSIEKSRTEEELLFNSALLSLDAARTRAGSSTPDIPDWLPSTTYAFKAGNGMPPRKDDLYLIRDAYTANSEDVINRAFNAKQISPEQYESLIYSLGSEDIEDLKAAVISLNVKDQTILLENALAIESADKYYRKAEKETIGDKLDTPVTYDIHTGVYGQTRQLDPDTEQYNNLITNTFGETNREIYDNITMAARTLRAYRAQDNIAQTEEEAVKEIMSSLSHINNTEDDIYSNEVNSESKKLLDDLLHINIPSTIDNQSATKIYGTIDKAYNTAKEDYGKVDEYLKEQGSSKTEEEFQYFADATQRKLARQSAVDNINALNTSDGEYLTEDAKILELEGNEFVESEQYDIIDSVDDISEITVGYIGSKPYYALKLNTASTGKKFNENTVFVPITHDKDNILNNSTFNSPDFKKKNFVYTMRPLLGNKVAVQIGDNVEVRKVPVTINNQPTFKYRVYYTDIEKYAESNTTNGKHPHNFNNIYEVSDHLFKTEDVSQQSEDLTK